MTNMKGTVGQTYKPRSGATYTTDSSGNLGVLAAGVFTAGVASADVTDLLNDGCGFAGSSQPQGSNGLYVAHLKLLDFKNTDGSALAAAASSGKFGVASTLGTSFGLVGEGAVSNTKTDDAIIEYTLPSGYVAGQNLTVTVNAATSGAGTLSTKTAQIKGYLVANAGTEGSDIGPGAAVAITPAGADIPFVITGTGLTPGAKLIFELETVMTETAGTSTKSVINSIRVS